jgi:hypothetical protein
VSRLEDQGASTTSTSRQEHRDEREAISPLRQRMIEDMTVRNFGEKTRNDDIRQSRLSQPSSAARPIRRKLR